MNISTTAGRPTAAFRLTAAGRLKGFDKTFFGDPDDSYSKANVNVGTFAHRA